MQEAPARLARQPSTRPGGNARVTVGIATRAQPERWGDAQAAMSRTVTAPSCTASASIRACAFAMNSHSAPTRSASASCTGARSRSACSTSPRAVSLDVLVGELQARPPTPASGPSHPRADRSAQRAAGPSATSRSRPATRSFPAASPRVHETTPGALHDRSQTQPRRALPPPSRSPRTRRDATSPRLPPGPSPAPRPITCP